MVSSSGKWKEFWFRFKIFVWYLATEPVRQLHEVAKVFIRILRVFNRTLTWLYLLIVLLVFALIKQERFFASFFLFFLLVMFLMWEWERGYFMYMYRERVKKRIKEEVKKKEIDKMNKKLNGDKEGSGR